MLSKEQNRKPTKGTNVIKPSHGVLGICRIICKLIKVLQQQIGSVFYSFAR